MSDHLRLLTRSILRRLPEPIRYVQENRIQARSGHPHEPEFAVFRLLAGYEPILVVDAGAHRGHSAISIFGQCENAEVVAFEPNPRLGRALDWVRRRYLGRFRFYPVALGARSQSTQLLVPRIGRHILSTSASARPSEFDKDYVRARLQGEAGARKEVELEPIDIRVEPLDTYGLRPDVVKIDVEGMEAEVIRGGMDTIRSCLPVILVEINNHREFTSLLEPLGYRFYRYDPERGILKEMPSDRDEGLPGNAFAVHPRSSLALALSLGAE